MTDRYIKTKIRTFGDKVYTNFRGLNVQENDTECKSFKIMYVMVVVIWQC